MYSNALVTQSKNAFDQNEFDELADYLYEIYNDIHDFAHADIEEVKSFCEFFMDNLDAVLEELENNYAIESFLRILDILHKKEHLPENCSEDVLLKLANWVHDFGESADDYSSGYALALAIYPNCDQLVHAIINSLVDHAYICESAFSNAISRCSDESRKKLLAAIDLLSAFYLGKTTFSTEQNMSYLSRDVKSYKQSMPNFSIHDFNAAKVFISSSTPLVQKYFTFPEDAVMTTILEIVGE